MKRKALPNILKAMLLIEALNELHNQTFFDATMFLAMRLSQSLTPNLWVVLSLGQLLSFPVAFLEMEA